MDAVNLNNLEPQVLFCEEQRRDAMLRGDVPKLASLLAAELVYGHSTGAIDTKSSYLEKIRSGANVYEELELAVSKIIALEQGALVIGNMTGRVRLPDQLVDVKSRFMTVWQSIEGNWKLVGHQTVATSSV